MWIITVASLALQLTVFYAGHAPFDTKMECELYVGTDQTFKDNLADFTAAKGITDAVVECKDVNADVSAPAEEDRK
jgi:hypothetical protein